jgi:hypothetical protein
MSPSPRVSPLIPLVVAATLALAFAGCAITAAEIAAKDQRPGLADVRVLGPKGRKCFDFCAQSEAACKHMCPGGTHGECRADCEADTRNCLEDCPELQRPLPPPKK